MVDLDEFASRLRLQLQDAGLTYRAASSKTGVTTTTVNGWCNAQSPPSYAKLKQFADGLSIRVGPLLDDSGPPAGTPVTHRVDVPPRIDRPSAKNGPGRGQARDRNAKRQNTPAASGVDDEAEQLLRECAALHRQLADSTPDLLAVLARVEAYVRDRLE